MTERDAEEFFIFHGHIHRIPKNNDPKDIKLHKDMLQESDDE